jgi:hypothetical protein
LIDKIALTAPRMTPKFGSSKNYARQREVAMNGRDNTTSSRRSDVRRFPSIAVTRLCVRLPPAERARKVLLDIIDAAEQLKGDNQAAPSFAARLRQVADVLDSTGAAT